MRAFAFERIDWFFYEIVKMRIMNLFPLGIICRMRAIITSGVCDREAFLLIFFDGGMKVNFFAQAPLRLAVRHIT